MALVFRKNQNVPLSNAQLDGNFEFLRDQLLLKYNVSDFTAENVSIALNTPAEISAGNFQTTIQLSESNALDAWTLRTLAPSYLIPSATNKASIVQRGQDGDIKATLFIGDLEGNSDTCTLADAATIANSLSNTYTVPVERGGTGSNNAANARTALEVLHTGGSNNMTNKLKLAPSASGYASINFGTGQIPTFLEDGDMWALSDGVYYRASGTNYKIAPISSPIFTGQPQAPDASGVSSQIATISHINVASNTLNQSIALKSNIDSPTFTGIVNAPTVEQTVNNTQVATTSYVHTSVNNKASVLTTSYENYTDGEIQALQTIINGLLDLKANTNSPYLAGTPTSVSPVRGDVSQRIATTEFTADALGVLNDSIQAALSSLTALVNSTRPVPTGSVFFIASTVVPSGFLECAGQTLSTFTYPSLWQALGSPAPTSGDGANTFRLPDLRGEFIRGWDNGRGIDSSRTLMSYQEDQIERHKHIAPYSEAFTAPFGQTSNTGYQGSGRTDMDNYLYYTNDGSNLGSSVVNANGVIGNETRPRNVALMPIIKH